MARGNIKLHPDFRIGFLQGAQQPIFQLDKQVSLDRVSGDFGQLTTKPDAERLVVAVRSGFRRKNQRKFVSRGNLEYPTKMRNNLAEMSAHDSLLDCLLMSCL
jgi:hypothetical protein